MQKSSEETPKSNIILGVPKSIIQGFMKNPTIIKKKQAHGQTFIGKPCSKRSGELLSVKRNQLKTITGLVTVTPVKEHLNKIGLYNGYLL